MMIAFEREMYPKAEKLFERERTSLLRVQVLLGAEVVALVFITVLESTIG